MQQEQGKSPQSAHTPSSLNQLLKKHLTEYWPALWLTGEIFDLYTSPAGHQYFTLKDNHAAIKCVLFKQKRHLNLVKGKQVTVLAELSLYESRGDLQLNVMRTLDVGTGDWDAQLVQLKAKLSAQGLFDPGHKKTIPQWPNSLGIITSRQGAALHDVLDILKQRNPLIEVELYHSQVQGPHAPGQMIEQLLLADTANHDVILLTRGGGSKEDLWAFNDEFLARTIDQLNTPIISAVGHEIDESITDLVADMTCITPSAAAQLLSGDFKQQRQQLIHQSQLLHHLWKTQWQVAQQRTDMARQQLQKFHPKNTLKWQRNQIENIKDKLQKSIFQHLHQAQHHTAQCKIKLSQQLPNTKSISQTLAQLNHQMATQIKHKFNLTENKLHQMAAQLHDRSPLHILSRGYSITRNLEKCTITNSKQVKIGETVETIFKSGKIRARITERLD